MCAVTVSVYACDFEINNQETITILTRPDFVFNKKKEYFSTFTTLPQI